MALTIGVKLWRLGVGIMIGACLFSWWEAGGFWWTPVWLIGAVVMFYGSYLGGRAK